MHIRQNRLRRLDGLAPRVGRFFSFEGEMGRGRFATWAIACLGLLILCAYAVWISEGGPVWPGWFLRVNILNAGMVNPAPSPLLGLAIMATTLLVDLRLAAVSFRRARSLSANPSLAALVVVPVLQVLVVALLVLLPRRARAADASRALADLTARGALQGLMAGLAITLGVVGVSAGFYGLYGYTLFMASPFVIGLTTAYLANRSHDVGARRTMTLTLYALAIGGAALVVVAFEGAICLAMASPLIVAMALVGALSGRLLSRFGRLGAGATSFGVALLPLLVMGETAMPPTVNFESRESVEIAASADTVWNSIVHMGPIPDAPAAPFRWGLAYPMRGTITGSGVGAIRQGVFSTGVAYERVTEWRPGRRLSFVVLSDPPTLHELSPYPTVHARHLVGYFRTRDAVFTLTPMPNGDTRLTLATHHELDLAPGAYWELFARWAVHANKVRVLRHFRGQAEAAEGAARLSSFTGRGQPCIPGACQG